jgi:hypothetical protein
MGWLRKITGVQGQMDAANRNADAQIAATQAAEQNTVAQMNANAKAVSEQQAQFAARQRAEAEAAAAAALPLEQAEVRLDEASGMSAGQERRARKRKFGQTANTGVNI